MQVRIDSPAVVAYLAHLPPFHVFPRRQPKLHRPGWTPPMQPRAGPSIALRPRTRREARRGATRSTTSRRKATSRCSAPPPDRHFVIGSGAHARAYLHRTLRNTLVELPLAWYAEKGGYWAMNPGYHRPDHEGFRRKIGYDCMFCHNGYPNIPAGHDQPFAEPVTWIRRRSGRAVRLARC